MTLYDKVTQAIAQSKAVTVASGAPAPTDVQTYLNNMTHTQFLTLLSNALGDIK